MKTLDNARVFPLLERIARRDEAAFRELYKAFSRKVYAYVLNQVRDTAQAEEIVADTLYDVWRFPDRFRGESQFSTWLIGIARNKVLMAWRARRPDSTHDDIDDVADSLTDDGPGSFELLAEKQRREGVAHCLARLSDEHRACMHLVFYEGASVAEVAEVQGIPEGTVKTRLFHARQKMKDCLRRMLEAEGTPVGSGT